MRHSAAKFTLYVFGSASTGLALWLLADGQPLTALVFGNLAALNFGVLWSGRE